MINEYFNIFFGLHGDASFLLKKDTFTVIDFNKKAMKLHDISFENKQEIIGKYFPFFKLSEVNFNQPDDNNRIFEEIRNNGKWTLVLTLKTRKGLAFRAKVTITLLTHKKTDYLLLVTEKVLDEDEKIKNNEKKYGDLVENFSNAIVIVDENNNTREINKAAKELFELEEQEDDKYNLLLKNKIFIKEKLKELREKGTVSRFEIQINTAKGIRKDLEISCNALYENRIFKGSVNIIRDISENKKRNLLLIEQSSKIKSIFENSSNVVIWTLDTNFNISSLNNEFIKLFNDRVGAPIKKGDNFFKKLNYYFLDDMEVYYEKAKMGLSQKFEAVIHRSDRENIVLETFLTPIKITGKNKFDVACLAVDLTDKKEIELRLRKLLTEKEFLLKEVHHRVKNNLQVISSILNLQSSYVKDKGTLEILRESQNRIKSMSFIHERLYRSDDFSSVNFSGYINSLSSNLVRTYIIDHGNIKLDLDLGDFNLSLDQAIPCGLILNELISNSIKYAFPGNREGKIRIELYREGGKIYFNVSDNGVGLPDNLDVEKTDSLGLQLVYILISQLDGDITVISKKGTTFLFNFTIED